MPESTSSLEDAQQVGYLGSVRDKIPNDDYAVSADHEATAKAQREQLAELRRADHDPDPEPKAAKPKAKSSPAPSSS